MAARPTVVVLDYGSGNLRSAQRALDRAGASVSVTSDVDLAMSADGLVVPGVGAFASCMQGIRQAKGPQLIDRRLAGGRAVLGICVGMQVMFEQGVERGQHSDGLGEWPGTVEQLQAPILPHMGWNTVNAASDSVLFDGIEDERFYFVHSYALTHWDFPQTHDRQHSPKVSWSHHGQDFVAAIENGPLSAVQFHPEKSGNAGVALLTNWLRSL